MKLLFSFTLLVFILFTSSAYSKVPLWQEDIDTAFKMAQENQKNIIIMVEDEDCRWCIKMKKGTLSNEAVQKKLQKFILTKIDRNDNKNMESIEGLRGPIPSFHFFTPQKKRIDTIAGYYQAEDFLEYINEIIEDTLQ
ncbi:MAG: thioredoxin family protein [Campylobacterota bacterium]|nr:thioredoxin family protein [Campylobacterota bacterium]